MVKQNKSRLKPCTHGREGPLLDEASPKSSVPSPLTSTLSTNPGDRGKMESGHTQRYECSPLASIMLGRAKGHGC